MIAIIDYNMGNLASVYNACKLLNVEANIESNPENLKNYDKVILPGVGAFADAMEHLNETGMKEAILEYAASGKDMLGICLGMQLLFESSEEFGNNEGLGLIPGRVVHFDKSRMNMEDHKVPHMGWNVLFNNDNKLFKDVNNPYLYFVHSFHAITEEKYQIGKTLYGYEFTSAVNRDNIYGFQPHPEKSHDNGLRILKNFTEV